MYESEEVADAVIGSKAADEQRDHAEARGCAAAKQYLVAINDDVYRELTQTTETGFHVQAKVGDDKESKEGLKRFLDDTKTKSLGDRPKTQAEIDAENKVKEEKRKKLAEKKAEKEKQLENDVEARTKHWLNGINKDLGRIGTNLTDIALVPDADTKDLVRSSTYLLFLFHKQLVCVVLYNMSKAVAVVTYTTNRSLRVMPSGSGLTNSTALDLWTRVIAAAM